MSVEPLVCEVVFFQAFSPTEALNKATDISFLYKKRHGKNHAF